MNGECFEHDLRWFSGGVECPVCRVVKLAADLNNRTQYYGFEVSKLIIKAAQPSVQAAKLCPHCNLPLIEGACPGLWELRESLRR